MSDAVAFLLFGSALLAAVGVGEALRAWAGWRAESSRRVVHMMAGLLVAAAVPWFSTPAPIYLLALVFVGVNLIALGRGLLPGMHAIERKSWGTVTFPLALIFALLTCWSADQGRLYVLQIAFLVLAVSDPLASFVGTRLKDPRSFVIAGNTKSLAGSMAFLLSAMILIFLALWFAVPEEAYAVSLSNLDKLERVLTVSLIVAAVSASVEMLCGKGWDNFFIVLTIVAAMSGLLDGALPTISALAPLAACGLFGWVAVKARFLDASGAVCASLLGFLLLLPEPALPWLLPPLSFFVLASLLSKVGKGRKASAVALADKTDRRDMGQVLANGGAGGALALAFLFLAREGAHGVVRFDALGVGLYWAFVGSFAAASADTWSTEIGTLFRWRTWRILTAKRVEPGESGGVSSIGLLGGVVGSCVVVAAAWFANLQHFLGYDGASAPGGMWDPGAPVPASIALMVALSGILASLIDSILGATLQASYRDSEGRLTERDSEDGRPNVLVSGYRWMTNDRVNLACTAAGALIPLLYFLFVPSACTWCIR